MSQKGEALSLAIANLYEHPHLVPEELSAWFAVQTRPRHEKKVNSELREKGIHSFLPLHREKHSWSDRNRWVELPIFSQYLFVKVPITLESRMRVLQTSGVVHFVGASGRGTPIPEEQIAILLTIVAQGIPTMPHEFLRVGEKVRIRGGALDGIEGILSALKNDRSLVVSVDLIQKSVAIRINGFEVERL